MASGVGCTLSREAAKRTSIEPTSPYVNETLFPTHKILRIFVGMQDNRRYCA